MPKKKSPPSTSSKTHPLRAKRLTPDLSARIIEAFAASGSLKQAVAAAGLDAKTGLRTLHRWLERGREDERREERTIYRVLGDRLFFRESKAKPKGAGPKNSEPPVDSIPITGALSRRDAEYRGALFQALYQNVQAHCPALAKAFDIEVDRIWTERKKGLVWGNDPDPTAEAIRGIVIGSLRGRRQLKDPQEHLGLLVAHRRFHYWLALMHQAWKVAKCRAGHRLDMLQKMLPEVAAGCGFSDKEPPRGDADETEAQRRGNKQWPEITLRQIVKEKPAGGALLLVAYYTRQPEGSVKTYIKRARRAYTSQGLDWRKIQPFPVR